MASMQPTIGLHILLLRGQEDESSPRGLWSFRAQHWDWVTLFTARAIPGALYHTLNFYE
jgi:hypothetical protein